jgi:hypothetical protein
MVYPLKESTIMSDLVSLIFMSNNKDWSTPSVVRTLLDFLSEHRQIGLAPDRFGAYEDHTLALDKLSNERIQRMWEQTRGGVFERESPWHLQLSVYYGPDRRVVDDMMLWIDAKFFDEESRAVEFLNLSKQLYEWRGIVYGYIAHKDEYQEKTKHRPSISGHMLKAALPGIFWANFFGPLYVSWLGEEKFETVEAYHKERLPDGGWLLVTRPNILEYHGHSSRAHERKIIKHLGSYAFFESENPHKPTRAPESLVSTMP